MTAARSGRSWLPTLPALIIAGLAVVAAACGGAGAAEGADADRPAVASMASVRLADVAVEVGLDFRHGAFQWGIRSDPNAMMSGGLCWIDVDADGWLDLFVVNTWSEGEWGRWRGEGALPSSRLFRNDSGRFTDVTDEWGAGVTDRGGGCVAADLDLDGFTDLYVTTQRDNVLLWNLGGERFEADGERAGVDTNGWQAGAAVGDVNGDGWPDLFVTGYADLNASTDSTAGFPNPYGAEPDLLYLSTGGSGGDRPTFVDVAADVGIEPDRFDYGLGAVWSDVDRDGDLDLYVPNDTQTTRLYVNEPADRAPGFRLVDRGAEARADDDGAGMGVAVSDYDGDGRSDIVVTNLAGQGHGVFRSVASGEPWAFAPAVEAMNLPDLGQDQTGWGTTWGDLDLDGDLDLLVAHGGIPVRDLEADRQQLQLFENLMSSGDLGQRSVFAEATAEVGLDTEGRHLARGLAAADYDNDGDLDVAVGTIGGDLALLRNTGAGGHWLVVAPAPATPGTIVTVTGSDRTAQERELQAGSSYLSSEDPRAHFGLGGSDAAVTVRVTWPDGTVVERTDVAVDRVLTVEVASP